MSKPIISRMVEAVSFLMLILVVVLVEAEAEANAQESMVFRDNAPILTSTPASQNREMARAREEILKKPNCWSLVDEDIWPRVFVFNPHTSSININLNQTGPRVLTCFQGSCNQIRSR